jgi:DNA polymerase III subunit delta'
MARKKKATIQEVAIASPLVPLFTSSDLQEVQPVVYQILKNSFERDKVNHAYLLTGSDHTQLMQIALLMAQSLVCEHPDILACSTCDSCQRVVKNLYSDGVIINSFPSSIKKEEILQLQSDLANTALEQAQKKYAIIHHIEHSSPEAANSLLKFIEEPQSSSLTIILTTTDENSVLPTIRSRSQSIRCIPLSKPLNAQDFELEVDEVSWYAYQACAPTSLDLEQLLKKESFPITIESFKRGLEMINKRYPFLVYGQKQMFNLKEGAAREIVNDTFTIFSRLFKDVAAHQTPFRVKMSPKQGLDGLILTQQCQQNLTTNANLNLCVDQWLIELENLIKEESV